MLPVLADSADSAGLSGVQAGSQLSWGGGWLALKGRASCHPILSVLYSGKPGCMCL